MSKHTFHIDEEADLQVVVDFLLSQFEVPFILLLDGELGAGKTSFVKRLAECVGSTERVNSPTFAKVHEYSFPRGVIYHLDLYRQLPDPASFEEILLDSQSIICIEWACRLMEDVSLLSFLQAVGRPVLQLTLTFNQGAKTQDFPNKNTGRQIELFVKEFERFM